MGFEWNGEQTDKPRDPVEDALEDELSGLCDIALGQADTPDYRGGGGRFPSIPTYVEDVLMEFRKMHGDEAAFRLARTVMDVLEAESGKSPRSRSVRETASRFLQEWDWSWDG